jgi:sporulation protein YlmC with PRC-barrel domain
MTNTKLALVAALLAAAPAMASAQDIGSTIYGNDGNPVGTVEQVNEQVIVIDTGKHKAPVPVTLVFESETGPAVNATKEQVDAMMDKQVAEANAKRDAALVTGTAVMSINGNPAGTLGKVDLAADVITLDSPDGPIILKKEYFAVNPQGQLMALVTREQIASAAASRKAGGGAQ